MRSLVISGLAFWLLLLPQWGQNNITLFGEGPPPLAYTTRTKRAGARLNYYNFFLRLPNRQVAELQLVYPEGLGGLFQDDSIEVFDRLTDKKIPVQEVRIDREGRGVRLIFAEPIPGTRKELEIRITGVNNPPQRGMYQVVVQALGTEANPLFQTLGRWLVDID
ncbi:MAG: DUF2808 domain-containing protein [Pseudanabaenaceae cyanobacterium]